MTIHAWRIVKAKHASTAFIGGGARKYGGRWNSPGVPMVYTAGSVSLAILEMLVHLQSDELMRRYVIFEVKFDEDLVSNLGPPSLPRAWRQSPAPPTVRKIGDRWVNGGKSAILRVPSAIVPTEDNYLLNPAHEDFAKIIIGPRQAVRFDPRLIKTPSS